LISERDDQARDGKGDKNGGRYLPVQDTEQGPRPPFGKHGIRKPPGGYRDNDGDL